MLVALILAVAVMMLTADAWHRSRIAFWVLLPYMAWALYIVGLNMAVWLNN